MDAGNRIVLNSTDVNLKKSLKASNDNIAYLNILLKMYPFLMNHHKEILNRKSNNFK